MIPVCRQMWINKNAVLQSVRSDTEEAADGRRQHHRRRPELVCGASSKGLEICSRKQLCDRAKVLRPGHAGILHQVGIAGQRTSGAVFCNRRPTGKERPYGTLMVADRVIEGLVFAQIT